MDKQKVFVDPLRQFPGYLLRRISSAIMAELSGDLGTLKLRPTEASILIVVEAQPGMTQSEIGRLLNIKRANMTPLAARLEACELIGRRKVDGRSSGLVLTAHGAATAAKAREIMEGCERGMIERIPREHRQAYLAALRALWESASNT
jgi:DNA-binding MarR family transcriptional regulator